MINTNCSLVNNSTVTEADKRNLEKARCLERKRKSEGWRWITINKMIKVFVPCDEKGNPTEAGNRMIEIHKSKILI